MVLFINLLTNPTATHALADAAYRLGIKPHGLVRNDLDEKGHSGRRSDK